MTDSRGRGASPAFWAAAAAEGGKEFLPPSREPSRLLYADPSITRADSAIMIINLSFRRTITTFFPVSNVLFHKKAATLLALDDCRAALFY
jgi:hypothetical protein